MSGPKNARKRDDDEEEEGPFGLVSDYVVVEIVERLRWDARDVARFGATCRRMRSVVTSTPRLWRMADPCAALGTPDDRNLTPLVSLLSLSGTLSLYPGMEQDLLSLSLVGLMPHVRYLSVELERADDVAEVLGNLEDNEKGRRTVRSISLEAPILPQVSVLNTIGRCSRLRSLELIESDDENPTPISVAFVLASAPERLQHLSVTTRSAVLPFGIFPVRRELLELSLRSGDLEAEMWECSCLGEGCPNLVSLEVRGHRISIDSVWSLCDLKHLRVVSLDLACSIPDDDDQEGVPKPQAGDDLVLLKIYVTRRHRRLAEALEGLANARDCEPFEKVSLFGGFLNLSKFFSGRRCRGFLQKLFLACWVPDECCQAIADNCWSSLTEIGVRGEAKYSRPSSRGRTGLLCRNWNCLISTRASDVNSWPF